MQIIEYEGLTFWMMPKKEFRDYVAAQPYRRFENHYTPEWVVPNDGPMDRWKVLKEAHRKHEIAQVERSVS